MSPEAYVAQSAVAQERLMAAAERLAGVAGLEAQLAALQAPYGLAGRDPQVRALRERERVIDLIEALADHLAPVPDIVLDPPEPIVRVSRTPAKRSA